jgi:hypothetical protein
MMKETTQLVAAVAWEAAQRVAKEGSNNRQIEPVLEAGCVDGRAVIAVQLRLTDFYKSWLDMRLAKTKIGRLMAEASAQQKLVDAMAEIEEIAKAVASGSDADVFIKRYGATLVIGDPGVCEFLVD